LTGKNAWRYAAAPLMYPRADSRYGTSSDWARTLNTGIAAAQGYSSATVQGMTPDALLRSLSTGAMNNAAAHYATVELSDSAAQNTMAVTGSIRANAQARAQALARLTDTSLSDAQGDNTEVAVLNKVNGATLFSAHTQQETNALLAAIADQQTVQNKAMRDAIVSEINASIAAQAAAERNTQNIWGGHTAAMTRRLR
jgi:hypothetical protein